MSLPARTPARIPARAPARLGGRRADLLALGLLLLLALAVRAAFYSSAPPFLNPDSEGYYPPGRNLASGDGFDLGLRRTPTYPLFIAAVVSVVGENLQSLVTVQHAIFGPLLVGLTYALGRLVATRAVAVGAAALTAVSGPLLLYEHYVMTEVPFAILLLGLLVALVLAVRRASFGWAALAGVLFGALVLCRPSGQILAPLVVGVLLLAPVGRRRRAALIGVLAACTLAVVVPWMAYNLRTQGVFTIAGGGRFLLARTLKMDPGGFTFEARPGVVEEPTRAAVRKIVQEEAARRRPGSVAQRLRDELGLTDAEAYPHMQALAIEAILNRPGYFISSSIAAFVQILVGEPIDVRREGVPVADADFERRARAALRAPVYRLNAARAQALLSIYDPARYGPLVPVLAGAGLLVAALVREWRWMVLPGLAALAVMGGSAALVGPEPRYRFPQDPLLALLACTALAAAARALGRLTRRARPDPALGERLPAPRG